MAFKPSTRNMTSGQRIAGVTPDGLRLRILDAIPEWEKWPRSLRKMSLLFPTHGTDTAEIAEAAGLTKERAQELVKAYRSFRDVLKHWKDTGRYPDQRSPLRRWKRKRGEEAKMVETVRGPLRHSDLVAQFANEMTILALIKTEDTMDRANAQRIAEKAGWFENIEADTDKRQKVLAARNDAYAEKQGKRIANDDEAPDSTNGMDNSLPLPQFDQTEDVDEAFNAVTETAGV